VIEEHAAVEAVPLTVEEVYRRHHTLLLRWTTRLAGPRVDLEDAMQEVLVQVHRSLPGFRGDALLTTWLYQVTRRVVARWRRREKVRRWLFGGGEEEEVDAPSDAPGPAVQLERAQRSEQLYRALDQLSEKHRTAFLLFEMEQLPAEEIARIMNTKPGTVWVWLHRARAKLRELLDEEVRR
jgi:RNA polymerase sigma-70 factor (ECF subfamily)